MEEALRSLPPKVLLLRDGRPAEEVTRRPTPRELGSRVADVIERINNATFTGSDSGTVPELYREYATRIADSLQSTLAIASAGVAAVVELPPMPPVTAPDAGELPAATYGLLRSWHVQALCAQHARIQDALSGRTLATLDECVTIAVTGTDATTSRALDVRDAAGLSAWLRSGGSPCALLTAGPAAGKSWLLSQVLMHALDDEGVVPILVRVELLRQRMLGDEAAFASSTDWNDAFLRLECAQPHHRMLRQAMDSGRALLLIDGLDEAGSERERIERHVADELAPRGNALLCTSRPAGLGNCFAAFHRLELSPLSEAQQRDFLVQRLGTARAAELAPYLQERVPIDAETHDRVTSNPCVTPRPAARPRRARPPARTRTTIQCETRGASQADAVNGGVDCGASSGN